MDLDSGKDWYYYADSNSESSSQDRCINEWENEMNADGSLHFVKHYLRKDDVRDDSISSVKHRSNQSDKTFGILSKFIRRRNSRRTSRRKDDNNSNKKDVPLNLDTKITKNRRESDQEDYQVLVSLNSPSVNQLSVESLFGFKTGFNNINIIVNEFLPDKISFFDSKVSLGDRLYSINGTVVNKWNLDEVLLGLNTTDTKALLGFQKITKNTTENEFLPPVQTGSTEKGYHTIAGGVLYAKYEGLSESGPADQGILYSFPRNGNLLTQIRGAFFTLSHLLSSVSSSTPKSSTIKFNDRTLYITYVYEKSELLLVSFPDSLHFLEESIRMVNSVVRSLEFLFQSLTRCFSNKNNEDFLDTYFLKLLTNWNFEEGKDFPEWKFEMLLPAPSSIFLPKEVYVQIDDALNELESNYICSQDSRRLCTVIGSCYFYKGFMMCNHLPKKDLLDVTALMKQHGILKLCKEGVKDFIYWREVYPSSCQRGATLPGTVPYSVPVGKWFLLIVGMDYSFLGALFEDPGYISRQPMKGPIVTYVEETQATLKHIMKIDFPGIINKQLNVNTEWNEDFREQATPTDSSSSLSSYDLQLQNKQYFSTESHRPLKARQDIRILGSYADVDYIPEEELVPVLGRRAERELAMETNSQSRISFSDVSDDSDWLKDCKSNDASDLNDVNKNISPDDCIASPRFSLENENILIHFINFEASEGILISSIVKNDAGTKYQHILQTFRQHAYKIQKIFVNTILFKKLKSQENPEIFNKSLVAVHEYGTQFQYVDETNKTDTESYWVVGKLYFMPHPREVYVCYLDICPQSIVEVAFQLALSCVR